MKTFLPITETFKSVATPQKIARRTISGIIVNKLLDLIEKSSFGQLSTFVGLLLLAAVLTSVLTYTDAAVEIIMKFLQFGNWLAIKMTISILFCFNMEKIFGAMKDAVPEMTATKGKTIEGIPVDELLDHLFEFESFKRDDIEGKFGIPRNRFTDLAKKFDDIGILVRGENNSRVLNPEFTRSDIAMILEGKSNAEDLRRLSRMTSERSSTSEPSRPSMLDRLADILPQKREEAEAPSLPSRRFTIRKINSDTQPLR